MTRLLAIAIASIVAFILPGYLFWRFGWWDHEVAGWISVVGFFATLVGGLLFWRAPDLSKKCPCGSGTYPECLYIVSFDGSEVEVTDPDGKKKSLNLQDTVEISVVTNDSGPWGADVWWLFVGPSDQASLSYPQGATGDEAALEVLLKLPGFNEDALIKAMGCTSNARFVCWSASNNSLQARPP